MKNQFRKEYKWILSAVIISIVIIICTACGKEEEGQKMMVSAIGIEALNDKWNSGMQSFYARIAESWNALQEQPDDLSPIDNLADLWQEANLPSEDKPTYWYFTHEGRGNNYEINLSYAAAVAVKAYAVQNGLENEEWELKRIIYNDGIYHAYVESATGNELYILLLDKKSATYMCSIIAADIRDNDDAEMTISVEGKNEPSYYNSMLEWNSYSELFENSFLSQSETEPDYCKLEVVDSIDEPYSFGLYDSGYEDAIYFALHDYVHKIGKGIEGTWIIDSNSVYVGPLVDVYCTNGEKKISLLIDTWNRRYTVLKCG